MAEGFRAASSNENTANSADVSGSVPAGVAANDGIIISYAVAGTGSTVPTPPSGYTQVGGPFDKGTVLRTYFFAKVATGADAGASVTVTKSTADATKKYITIAAYSGIDTANFVSTLTATIQALAETTAGTAHSVPAVTVTGSSNWVGEFMVDRGSPASTDITPASGFTERAQQVGTGTGTCTTEWSDSGSPVAAGTHSGDVMTGTVSTANAITVAMVIPAAGGTSATATPAVLTATASFFTPTVLNGSAVKVNPDVLRMSTAFFPVVGAGGATVTPDLLVATVSFFPPTVSAQATALTIPDPIAMSVTFFTPAITAEEVPPPDEPPAISSGNFKFRSPQRTEIWPIAPGERLAVKVEINLTMYRINGQWHAGENLSYTDLAGADRVYYGGYDVTVPDDELAEMVSQGFDVAVEVDDAGTADLFLDLFTETF